MRCVILPASRRDDAAPRATVGRRPDFKVFHPAVGTVLTRNVEQPFDFAQAAQVDDQVVRVTGAGADKFGVPDGGEVAIAGQ